MRFQFRDCVLDSDSRQLLRTGRLVALPPKCFQLLELLIRRRPRALSKEEIYRHLWRDTFVADASLANLVARIRSALGDSARNPGVIRTIPRFGYSFIAAAQDFPESTAPHAVAYRLLRGDRDIALASGENLIGRSDECAVWIDDVEVSRHHARIIIDEDGAQIEDLGSKNGTFLQGERIDSTTALADGDLIRVGEASMVFRQFDRTASTATMGADNDPASR